MLIPVAAGVPGYAPRMIDPSAVLAPIKANPHDELAWLALAAHYRENGRADEAAAVRVFWRAIREDMVERGSLDAVLRDVETHATTLGRIAREIEARVLPLAGEE